ncbi:unnamed protein product [Pleuronectes platessa]|uniref:Uncharacterized protein n=1 Tax=Pleuronectes platessa TaxID=8262 RepID=A0A9N7ZE01_PLEPL|nr:unnamed protein product [Pleuronectes platessa]
MEWKTQSSRYVFVTVGGCVLAVGTMGIYSALLFASTFLFILLIGRVDPSKIHIWAFGIQMFWQTFWHLLIQYHEYYLHEPVSMSYLLSVTTLLGGPLGSYRQFVCHMEGVGLGPSPSPLGVVFLKLMQVLLLELLGLEIAKIHPESLKTGAVYPMVISGPPRRRAACQSSHVDGTQQRLRG